MEQDKEDIKIVKPILQFFTIFLSTLKKDQVTPEQLLKKASENLSFGDLSDYLGNKLEAVWTELDNIFPVLSKFLNQNLIEPKAEKEKKGIISQLLFLFKAMEYLKERVIYSFVKNQILFEVQ
ncbi:hypothetical protein LCGC14_1056330 [marine sediment metagenome]|uniref:Uncharacterized protein n=1 Tax=marine sediment metagenome TaxID=412755 RepID=A0A0F9MMF5_9ZZZZ